MTSICSPHQRCCHKMQQSYVSGHMGGGSWKHPQNSVCVNSAIKSIPLRTRECVQLWKTSCSSYAACSQPMVLGAVVEGYPLQVSKDVTVSAEEFSSEVAPKKRRGRIAKEQVDQKVSVSTSTIETSTTTTVTTVSATPLAAAAAAAEIAGLRIFEGHGFTKAEVKVEMKTDKCTLQLSEMGVEMPALARCFDQSRGVPEMQWQHVLTVLSEFGVSDSELVVIITKEPSVLGGDANSMKQLLNFGVGQGIDSAVVISMCKMWPGLLFQSVDHVTQVIDYFTSVGLYRDELIKIIKLRPQLLGHQIDRIKYVVDCLLDCGVPVEDLPRIIRKAPELFSNTTFLNMASNLEFLVSMGLGAGALGKAVARRPNLLNYSLDSMKSTVQYLLSFMKPWDVPKLIRRYAEVLVLDPHRKMHPMINYLKYLGVKSKDIGKVVLRRPQLLGYTIPGLEPSVKCLMEFGVKQEMIGKVITTAPQILTLNVDDKLRPVVEFFRSMGLNKERDIELLLVRNGQILCCSIEKNLRPKFEFLLGLGLSTTDIANMIVLFPSMLGQSIEGSLGPKYNYLVNVMKRSVDEVIDFPQYFGYSLERRIIPRHEKLHSKAISTSLPSMLACVDHDFEVRYLQGKPPTRAPYKARRKVLS
ncbi:mTERF domain-containing protein, mitochondrial [Marchantia polymorpha subsp. ruderalis]|uniref:Uncharacterized protein n=2 Tax=Marchantia polymorpha TaxID=3197 RepID=A0A176W0G8_MARPO|nr:hypothetical protein AXG93_1712s1420 [Marchantia polymorpha subsp. ruderalis]PTQ49699.1 hypothetical protein MARPO_0002s0171 [Marchantia polymorpha]PTQ49700.1 hypothetical protein MARPO_0002s0171 [Marchantia polymorpha]PTQ49701.1 hypothetical protein MARPO_0002s0171 [Marchantia polymorpha]BBN00183.1 hypothetical protein Mp_1g27070 [Marchantia polymorpha subsp. ruderalis]|eukprot:PTQ49699.1 hypothetical protein MARPO_0002s0171 [Marchantia polymorpha]